MAAFQPLITGETGRATRIRLVAAAMLQRKGRKEEAAALLTGRDPVIRAAHAMVQAGKRLRTGIATPAEGMAERSEEHTSELQSLMRMSYAAFCLEKKKEQRTNVIIII